MDVQPTPIHWSFWVIGALTLTWNVLGGVNFIMQMNPEVVAAMPETHQAIIAIRPPWATGAFALAVFGGALGALLLLMRKRFAIYVFIASLVGVAGTMIPHIGMIGSIIANPFEIVIMIFMPMIVAVFQLWYSRLSRDKSWIA